MFITDISVHYLADLSPFIKELFVSERVAFCDGYKFDHLKRRDARSLLHH